MTPEQMFEVHQLAASPAAAHTLIRWIEALQDPPATPQEVATANGSGVPSSAPADPQDPSRPGGLLSEEEALARLEAYWESLHCILWFDWDLGRPDCREKARQGALKFLRGMGVVASRGDESLTAGS